ncbi:hypothetical protein ACFL1L_01700 [Thermoplasmatota archaeon]
MKIYKFSIVDIIQKKKEVKSITEKPFKNREEVKKEIRICGMWCNICELFGFLFAILGVIAGLFDITLGLNSTSWLLLAVFIGLTGLAPHIHIVVAKHLYGIESESNNK